MGVIDRRSWLAGAVAAIGAAVAPRWASAAAAVKSAVTKPPIARVEPVSDKYFGDTVVDPYRWMENPADRDWLPYLRGQNDYTRSILDALPARARLHKRIGQLSGDVTITAGVQRVGRRVFYQQRAIGADNFKLYVREGGRVRTLVDPVALGTGRGGHLSLDWWRASPDGSHVAYGLSRDGSEDSILHVMVVATARDLPERIADTEGASPQWLDDGSGFFYTQLTGKVDTPERYLDARARFHRVGTDPANDPILVERGKDSGLGFDRIQTPTLNTFAGSRHVVLKLADVRREVRLLIAPIDDVLAGHATWQPVATFDDEATDVDVHGDSIYLLVNKAAPRGRVVRVAIDAPTLAQAHEVVPQGTRVIESMARAHDGLYLSMIDGGLGALRKLDRSGALLDIALPFDGTVGAVFADPGIDGVWAMLSGWLTPTGIWAVETDGRMRDTAFTPAPAIDTSRYESKRMMIAVRDGTEVPCTVIHRKGLVLDGRNPTFISAYGSYGVVAYSPAFAGRTLALIDEGAVVGYASVRGGGEYGRDWHRAGQLENKPNTWRDLIDVCERLCKLGYTAPAHLAIGGRSAGGITVGMALTERPDLFAAVIDGVGWSNPLRYVAEQNGYGEEPEWGAIDDPAGYRALKGIDSYQAVRDGVAYPAVLLTTGVTDPRVAPFHVAKMAARLQAATSSGKPVLLRVDFDAGHGLGSTRAQQDREAADTYAFLLAQLGDK